MGSVDLPPFLKDKMKEKVVPAATSKPEQTNVLPPFLKKKEVGVGYGLPSNQSQSNSNSESLSAETQPNQQPQEKPPTKQDVQSYVSHLTTKYFADIIPDAAKSGIDPRKLIEGVNNGNANDLKTMRDQITQLLNKRKADSYSTAITTPTGLRTAPIVIKTPEQQLQLQYLNSEIEDVNKVFNNYIGYALTDKYKKISGGNINNIDYKNLGSDYNVMTNDEGITKKQKIATESNLPEGKAVRENLDYGNARTGLQLAIQDLKSSFEQDVQEAVTLKDPNKLLSAKVKSDQYNDLFNKYNNLLDQYPSVAKNYVAQVLGDQISKDNPAFNLYVSKDDIAKASAQIEQTNPGFINKYAKYVDELKSATGGFLGSTSPVPTQGLTGALNRGMQELDLAHWFSSEENKAARELSLQQSAFGHGTSFSGKMPTKIVLDDKGTSFIEKENEDGNGIFNNAMRVVGEGIPGLAEWTIVEELTGGIAGGLIGDVKAARYTKALVEAGQGGKLSKVAGLEDIAASEAMKKTIGLYGAQYLVSYDHNYEFANEIVNGDAPQDEFKKKVIANIVTIGQGTAFKLLGVTPSSIMGKSFANNLTKDAYEFVEKNAGKIDQESLYKFYQNSVVPKAMAIAESLGEGAKFGGVSVLNQALQDVTGNMFSDKYKGSNAQDYSKIFTESALLGFMVNMVPKITKGISVTNKDALGLAGVFNKELAQQSQDNVRAGLIDQNQANKIIQIANTMHESIAESSDLVNKNGLPLTPKQQQDISVLKFRKKFLEAENEKNVSEENNAVISEIDNTIENILGQNAYHQVDNSHFVNSMDITDNDGNKITELKNINPSQKYEFKNEDGITETLKGAKLINYIHDNFMPDEKTVSAQQNKATALQEKTLHEHGFDETGNVIKKKEGEQLTPEEQQQLGFHNQNILSHQKSTQNEKRNDNDQSKGAENKTKESINAQNENEGQKDVLAQTEDTGKTKTVEEPVSSIEDKKNGLIKQSDTVEKILGISSEDADALSIIYNADLTPTEKQILYRQYKNGVMNLNDVKNYSGIIDLAKLNSEDIGKWARAALEKAKSKSGEFNAEDIDFEEIPNIQSNETKAQAEKPTQQADAGSNTGNEPIKAEEKRNSESTANKVGEGTSQQINEHSEIKSLEKERDNKIAEISKPDLKLELISSKDLVKAKDPIEAKSQHDILKEKYKALRKLADCI